ncbi:hypothetical protein HELRODRAFT_158888 [Helobdella robusta]|uniref:Neural retina-specific leucine zipper protein n=1 Tax=Helobdella robusta TaxID=6412 RepID=T1END7_HELRO|nr:hypothetical protein HELRODRAFT_158888 [Helobdella robusta]ESO12379.1 hypothetical protein HELRODRAFT_158888 [Helobdella robusta]
MDENSLEDFSLDNYDWENWPPCIENDVPADDSFHFTFTDELLFQNASELSSSNEYSASSFESNSSTCFFSSARDYENIDNHQYIYSTEQKTLSCSSSQKHVNISSEQLAKLKFKELKRLFKSLPETKVQELKKKRRQLKNRNYAKTCRHKKITKNVSLEEEVKMLRQERIHYVNEISKYKEEIKLLKMKLEITDRAL